MLGKKISQNFAFNLMSMALGFISSIFIARIGGAAIFGNISLAISFQALLKSLFTHSVNNAHLKIYNDDNSVGVKNYLALSICFNLLTSLAIVAFVFWNLNSEDSSFSQLQLTLIVIFIVQDYLLTPLSIYVTDQYAKLNITRGNSIEFSSQMLINLAKIGAVLLGQTEVGIAWSIILACSISAIFPLFSLFKSNMGVFSMKTIQKYIRYCLYISTSALAYGLLLSFDKILLGFLAVSPENIGYYNASNRLGILLMSLGVSVGGIFLSVFSKNIQEGNLGKTLEQLRQYERYITVFFLPLIMVPIFFGEEILTIIYGGEFAVGYPVLVFVLFVAYIKTSTIPFQNYLFANNRFKEFNRTSVIFALTIVLSTTGFAWFNLFEEKTTSVAFGLLVSCVIERVLFLKEASKIEPKLKLFFYPEALLFFVLMIAGWFFVKPYLAHDLILSIGVRLALLVSILPLGVVLKIYNLSDYTFLLKTLKIKSA